MGTVRVFANRFIELELIATHGQAEVYKAEHLWLDLPVALKIVKKPESDARDRLFIEAQAALRLSHPNVVRAYDFGLTPECVAFLSLEWLNGQTLADLIDRRGPLSVPKALDIASAVAQALCAAHEQRILHLDVKPSNIFLTKDCVKLLDFGCAEIDRPHCPMGNDLVERTVRGTLAYMCPHYAATGQPGPTTDVYSLACTLYEMLAGEHPTVGNPRFRISESSLELREVVSTTSPRPLHHIAPGTPETLSREIDRAMARSPALRHGTMREFLEMLERERARLDRAISRTTGDATDDSPTAPCGLPTLLKLLDAMALSREFMIELSLLSDQPKSGWTPPARTPCKALRARLALRGPIAFLGGPPQRPAALRASEQAAIPAGRGAEPTLGASLSDDAVHAQARDETNYGIPVRRRADWLLEAIAAEDPSFLSLAERRRRALQFLTEPTGQALDPKRLREEMLHRVRAAVDSARALQRGSPRSKGSSAGHSSRLWGIVGLSGLAVAAGFMVGLSVAVVDRTVSPESEVTEPAAFPQPVVPAEAEEPGTLASALPVRSRPCLHQPSQ